MADPPKPYEPTQVEPIVGPTAAAQPPDTHVGRYVIERMLGRGGMATVYLARDGQSGREVALKVLSPNLTADPTVVERFLREAQSAALVRHRHVVEVLDWGEDRGCGTTWPASWSTAERSPRCCEGWARCPPPWPPS